MSALDALTPDELAEYIEEREYRRLQRRLVEYGLTRMFDTALIRSFFVPNPGAGLDWAAVVPAGAVWDVLALRFQLATSAVVSNRAPLIEFRDQDQTRFTISPSVASIPASSTINYSYQAHFGGSNINTGGVQLEPLPSIPLQPGFTLRSTTVNLDAGDVLSAIMVTVREWTLARIVRVAANLLVDLDSAGGIRYVT